MTTGADSLVVNGNLLAFPQSYEYAPLSFGPQTVGVPQVSPNYPPFLGGGAASTPGAASVGGYGTADNNTAVTRIANAHPWNPKVSPVVWAIGGLVGALCLLKAIHWRETIEESGGLGPFSEEAGERTAG